MYPTKIVHNRLKYGKEAPNESFSGDLSCSLLKLVLFLKVDTGPLRGGGNQGSYQGARGLEWPRRK